MGKQRNSRGRRPPAREQAETVTPVANDLSAGLDTAISPEPAEPDLHESLLASTSAQTLEAAAHADAEPSAAGDDGADAAEPPIAAEPESATAPDVTVEPAAVAAPIVAEPALAAPAMDAAAAVEPVTEWPVPAASEVGAFAPPPPRTARDAFAPVWIDLEGIGAVLMNYMRTESVAALSHMRVLSAVRSPADLIRVQVDEMQRAADASLTCWASLARHAARPLPRH